MHLQAEIGATLVGEFLAGVDGFDGVFFLLRGDALDAEDHGIRGLLRGALIAPGGDGLEHAAVGRAIGLAVKVESSLDGGRGYEQERGEDQFFHWGPWVGRHYTDMAGGS